MDSVKGISFEGRNQNARESWEEDETWIRKVKAERNDN